MRRRRLRFDARKNFERKKYSECSELVVSVLLDLVSVPADDANPSELSSAYLCRHTRQPHCPMPVLSTPR